MRPRFPIYIGRHGFDTNDVMKVSVPANEAAAVSHAPRGVHRLAEGEFGVTLG